MARKAVTEPCPLMALGRWDPSNKGQRAAFSTRSRGFAVIAMTSQHSRHKAWPTGSYDPRARDTEQTRAFLSLCQQKKSSTDEPKAEGGPSDKKSRSPVTKRRFGNSPLNSQ